MKLILLFLLLSFAACSQSKTEPPAVIQKPVIRYVAIGDSYTIGEGATEATAFPAVLTEKLRQGGVRIELVANPARTGWTTQMAIDRELPVYENANPGFATLLIGVNDWVRGVDELTFRYNLVMLIERMLYRLPQKNRLLLITIPDFSVTPQGSLYGNGRNISAGIAAFNRIIVEEAAKRQLPVVDIFEVSKQMGTDRSLVADDGLHPSAKMYAVWAEMIFPVALKLLNE